MSIWGSRAGVRATEKIDVKDAVLTVADTNIILSGNQTLNGYLTQDGDRVIVVGQTNSEENGVYESYSEAWTRSSDADTDEKVTTGLTVFVANEASDKNGMRYTLVTTGTIVLDTTPLLFNVFPQLSTDSEDGGVDVGNKLHLATENEVAGSVCLHIGTVPIVNTTGYRLWVDNSGQLKLLLPNVDPSIKVNIDLIKPPKITVYDCPEGSSVISSYTFTPDSATIKTVVEMCGGGGGAGSLDCNPNFISIAASGGGASFLRAETYTKLTGSIAIIVGNGGQRPSTKPIDGQNGIAGNDTSFGNYLKAFGGGLGYHTGVNSVRMIYSTGSGGNAPEVLSPFSIILTMRGGAGRGGYTGKLTYANFIDGGDGGDSYWGMGSKSEPALNGSSGWILSITNTGAGYGQGGCGIASNGADVSQQVSGGSGRPGRMIITEYFS